MSIEESTITTITEPSTWSVVQDPALVVDWSVAIQQANLHRVQRLLRSHHDLLWTPLTAWDPERDASHVITQLKTVQQLGSSLDNLCAIHYTLLQYNEPVPGEKSTLAQLQTGNLLWFLIESATKQDLENESWGNCNNRTLHLVSFLGHQQVARRLLDDKNLSTEIPNDLGFFARDVALSEDLFHLLSPINMMDDDDKKRLSRKPQYSSNNRFNQLRQLAETTSSSHKNINSTRQAEGRYFRSGHVAESKRKVLNEEEAELEKQRLRRQQEVAMLAKRSAVKNNPLFKRFEQQQKQHKRTTITNNTTVALSKSGSATEISSDNNNSNSATKTTNDDEESTAAVHVDEEPKKKRNSKVISALRGKSIVSSSIFLQTEPERTSSPAPPRSPQFTPSIEDSSPPKSSNQDSPKDNSATTVTKETDNVTQVKELSEEEATRMDRRRLSGSQKSQWALGMNSWASIMERSHFDTLSSEDDNVSEGEQWFDSKEFEADDIKPKDKQSLLHQDEPIIQQTSAQQSSIDNIDSSTPARSSNSSNFDTTPSSSPSSSSLSSPILDSYPTSSSISPASTITTPPVQSITERSPDNIVHDDVNYGSISVSTTSRYIRRLSQAQNPALLEMQHRQEQPPCIVDEDDTKQSKFKIKRVPVKVPPSVSKPSIKQDPPTIRRSQSALQSLGSTVPVSLSLSKQSHQPKSARHGKLYLRINAATDMLLPLPNEPTYVRCVVSDDRYEYISRYALLGQHIPFEYECVIDTNEDPNMIITISLHVRPDHHLRSKLPLTRLFSTHKKHHHPDKGSLSSYICHDDGSIGRSRFALSHMLHGCYMCSYSTRFDCFNAWTPRQKHRSKEEADVLKVIGSLEIEMLYLPLNDPSMSVPRNLRDCDMAIKIQQWNETCWNTENLTSSRSSNTSRATENELIKNLQPTRSPSLF
ncbi:hypothetical protein K492DRAFT_203651 [Lichtheimia hyalospora FSU 10163]|nr:hypothetical protein K492DRAFT_203651 [Lichtheimia hyalospora FSU 10163]